MSQSRQFRTALIFIAPALLYFCLFWAFPVATAFFYAMSDWSIGRAPVWNSGANFVRLLDDPQFIGATLSTLKIGGVGSAVTLILALTLALALNDPRLRGGRFFRLAIIVPVVTDWVATGLVWQIIFLPNQGVLASFGATFGLPVLTAARWTTSAETAWIAIVIFIVWKQVGLYMIFFFAAVRSVPIDTIEAAEIDGAGPWRMFWSVRWPQMLPITVFVVVISFVTTVGLFEPVYMLTGGGPGDSTRTLPMFLYQHFFLYGTSGYASAAGIYFLMISLAFALVASRILRDKVSA